MKSENNIVCPSIHITNEDKARLQKMIQSLKRDQLNRENYSVLEAELNKAVVIESRHMPRNIVTMHSRVGLVDLETSERMVFTLVYPDEVDVENCKISVLAPLGSAMLGYHTGDEFDWETPIGTRRFVVDKVMYQPEARMRQLFKSPFS